MIEKSSTVAQRCQYTDDLFPYEFEHQKIEKREAEAVKADQRASPHARVLASFSLINRTRQAGTASLSDNGVTIMLLVCAVLAIAIPLGLRKWM